MDHFIIKNMVKEWDAFKAYIRGMIEHFSGH